LQVILTGVFETTFGITFKRLPTDSCPVSVILVTIPNCWAGYVKPLAGLRSKRNLCQRSISPSRGGNKQGKEA